MQTLNKNKEKSHVKCCIESHTIVLGDTNATRIKSERKMIVRGYYENS